MQVETHSLPVMRLFYKYFSVFGVVMPTLLYCFAPSSVGGIFPAGRQLVYKDLPVAMVLITAFNVGHSFLVLETPCVHLGVIRS
jgi:hypothetical protein